MFLLNLVILVSGPKLNKGIIMYIDEFLSKTLTQKINKLIEVDTDFKILKYKNGEVSGVSGKIEFFGFVRYFSLYNLDINNTDEILIGVNNVRVKFFSVLNEPISKHSDMIHSDLVSRWVYLNLKDDTSKTMRPVDDIIDEIVNFGGTVEEAFLRINNPYFNLFDKTESA